MSCCWQALIIDPLWYRYDRAMPAIRQLYDLTDSYIESPPQALHHSILIFATSIAKASTSHNRYCLPVAGILSLSPAPI